VAVTQAFAHPLKPRLAIHIVDLVRDIENLTKAPDDKAAVGGERAERI
jgi:hypothetical protein